MITHSNIFRCDDIGIQDFDNEPLTLEFYGTVNCRRTSIHINNDDINEAKEVFSIRLVLDYSRNPNLITLARNVSLGIIIDDDRKSGIFYTLKQLENVSYKSCSHQDWFCERELYLC